MTDAHTSEVVRKRWRRILAAEAMDSTGRDDFSLGGLGSRVEKPTARLLLLPSDPETHTLEFDDRFWEWLQDHRTMELGGREIELGEKACPTAHAAAIVKTVGWPEVWKSYAAICRNGAVDFGLGNLGAGTGPSDSRFIRLVPIVARVWAAIELAREVASEFAESDPSAPCLLAVALRNTKGALLGQLGEGWAQPWDFRNDVGECSHDDLLWHMTFECLPEDLAASQQAAFRVGDRIENAWGNRQKLYLVAGSTAGEFSFPRA